MRSKKLKIVLFGDPVLRQRAKPVTVFHRKLDSIIDSMTETLFSREDAAALAANQVAILKRIIVIDYEDEYFEMINPEIIFSDGLITAFEGCLSYPGYVGMVPRAEYVKVRFLNREGEVQVIERQGRMARCIQHEIDHLDGILFVDRMNEEFLIRSGTEEQIEKSEVLKIIEEGERIKENIPLLQIEP